MTSRNKRLGSVMVDATFRIHLIGSDVRDVLLNDELTERQREDLRVALQHLGEAYGILRQHMTWTEPE